MNQVIYHIFFLIFLCGMHTMSDKQIQRILVNKFDPKKTVYLIDGSSFLYRAYYALRPLHTKTGVAVHAVYGFCRMIKKIIDSFDPQYFGLVWDSKGPTIRHDIYENYKAQREAPPSDLFIQKDYIQQFADLIGLMQIEKSGFEADDLMYSIAKDIESSGFTTVLITSDKDMGQTITEHIFLYDPFKNQILDKNIFAQKMGFPVEKLPFYFSLLGDISDNIPGVYGIGKKNATKLVQQFSSLTELYEHLDEVPSARIRNALQENKDNAFLSEKLFILQYTPLNIPFNAYSFDSNTWQNARPLFQELEFKSLLKNIAAKEDTKEPLSQAKGYSFITVTTAQQLTDIIAQIYTKKLFAIDTELSGLKPLEDDLIGLCLCMEKGTAYYIPFGHTTGEQQLLREQVLTAFKPLLEDPHIKKIMHHAKFDMLALSHYGITTQGLIFDTLVAAHLVTEDWQRISLKSLSEFYLNEPMLTFHHTVSKNGYANFGEVPLALATEYGASDAHQTFQLYTVLQQLLHDQGMTLLYATIEFPLISVLFSMEKVGIYCDTAILDQLNIKVTQELARIREKISILAGPQFVDINLNSPKQLKTLLFDYLQLPPQKKGKTGYSTDQEVLEQLALLHPIPQLIVQYRSLFKLKNTYIESLPHYINQETGKIHTNFSQTRVATGRLSSSDPNLQNIPVEVSHHHAATLRSAFKPAPGHVFLSADYSQIELRVLAFLSQDTALVNAFLQEQDIHRNTASKLFDVSPDQVTHEQRQLGKRINFSVLYGLTPFGLAKDLNIPHKDARQYIEKYFAQYPQVSSWMTQVADETKEHGYVTTYWGRRRYLPGIYEKNRMLFNLARRMAINTKAQGTAAELMKKGMINLAQTLKEHNLHAQIILQIHDELLLSVPTEELELTTSLVTQCLENVVNWNVPLIVTVRSGDNWQTVTK